MAALIVFLMLTCPWPPIYPPNPDPNPNHTHTPTPHTHAGVHTMLVEFRVKFYMPDPGSLHEEVTRYQFYLQVKKDLYTTRYGPCPSVYMYMYMHAFKY